MDLALGLHFQRFQTIYDRIKAATVATGTKQQMQSKYSCSQSQDESKSCSLTYKINKDNSLRFSINAIVEIHQNLTLRTRNSEAYGD